MRSRRVGDIDLVRHDALFSSQYSIIFFSSCPFCVGVDILAAEGPVHSVERAPRPDAYPMGSRQKLDQGAVPRRGLCDGRGAHQAGSGTQGIGPRYGPKAATNPFPKTRARQQRQLICLHICPLIPELCQRRGRRARRLHAIGAAASGRWKVKAVDTRPVHVPRRGAAEQAVPEGAPARQSLGR